MLRQQQPIAPTSGARVPRVTAQSHGSSLITGDLTRTPIGLSVALSRWLLGLMIGSMLFAVGGCNWDPVWKKPPYRNKVVYYESDPGLYNRTDEITEEEASRLEAYFVGYFDQNSRVYRTENYFLGELIYTVNYEYHRDGRLMTQEMIRGDGRSELFRFDPEGRLVTE